MEETLHQLHSLFAAHTGSAPEQVTQLPSSGSNRRYFRMASASASLIGAIGTNAEENRVFIRQALHFKEKGLPVPTVYAWTDDYGCYLQEDLGEETLFDAVATGRESGLYSPEETALLCRAIAELPRFQFLGAEGLDWEKDCLYPCLDARTVDFDLNYFKYCFLKATGVEFNESALQDDFERLKADLLSESGDTFLHRDFQARNVIIRDGAPYFIDFQGGRRGPVYYDVASFVWQARSRFPEQLKQRLVESYLQALKDFREVDEAHFLGRLRLFVLFRTLQVLGAYGFRGFFEKKPHFIASVPYALDNLRTLLQQPLGAYPHLGEILEQLVNLPQLNEMPDDKRLEVHIFSFAFKKGIPADTSGNGGGYVFDCRGINNPGKYERYRQVTGTHPDVIRFLEDDGEVNVFLESVYRLVDAHVKRYMERKFTHLQVCFGCTGGQHRSVYCAEHLAQYLAHHYPVKIRITHREQNIEKRL